MKTQFSIPVNCINPNNNRIHLVSDIMVTAICNKTADGTGVVVDIDSVVWKGKDVTEYTMLCCPDKWDELMAAATNNFKSLNNEQ